MTTINDKMKAQIQKSGDYALAAGVSPIASGDPNNVNPIPDHQGESSINKGATGKVRHQLGGLNSNADINVEPEYDTAEYPSCQTNETVSGHVIELDDTRGQERVLIKHNTGAGIEMRSDGSIIVSTVNHKITIVNGDKTVKVAGDARMVYEGNLSVEVAGDYNLVVKGNMNTTVKGDVISNCDNRSETVDGNSKDIVKGHRSITSLQTNADLTMGDRDIVTKGNTDIISSGEATLASTGDLKLSSEGRMFGAATTAIQMGSAKMNLMGGTGTIGGEGVIAYVNNIYGTSGTFTEGVMAPTFEGNLKGKADDACDADYANTAGSAPLGAAGSPGSQSHTAVNTTATFEPTASNMGSYTTGVYGVNDIQIDLGDHLKNAIDKTVKSSGKAKSEQTIEEVRSTLKDEANLNDKTYTADAVASGKLNPEYLNTIPGETGRIVNIEPTEVQPKSTVQRGKDRLAQGRKVKPKNNQKQITVDPLYNPMKEVGGITPKTKLAKGITIAKFLGGRGDGTTLNHITAETDKQQLARNLYMHGYAMSLVNDDDGKFSGNSLVVDEGVYKAGPNETPTANSINDLAKDGRAIAYKLYSSSGQVDNIGLFDLAIYWKDNLLYEKNICDYDKFHPDNILDFQLILIMPTISTDFTGTFSKNLETKYNGKVMSSGELIEIF